MSRQKNINYINRVDFPARLAKLLAETGLTQAEFAQRIGVAQPNVSDWLKGKHRPTRSSLFLIFREFGEDLDGTAHVPLPTGGQVIGERQARYGVGLSASQQALVRKIEQLLAQGPPEIEGRLRLAVALISSNKI